jgi:hypothetical protein
VKIIFCAGCDKQQLIKGQEVAILIKNQILTSDSGDYYISESFFKNQVIYHQQCCPKEANFSVRLFEVSDSTKWKFINTLENMGEKIDVHAAEVFLSLHLNITDQNELIKLWFINRNE